MNPETYSKLRDKIKNRDFEAKNKSLNSWFFKSTFLGNLGSIFFAFFLVYPALYKAIAAQMIDGGGNWAIALATLFLLYYVNLRITVLRNDVEFMMNVAATLKQAMDKIDEAEQEFLRQTSGDVPSPFKDWDEA